SGRTRAKRSSLTLSDWSGSNGGKVSCQPSTASTPAPSQRRRSTSGLAGAVRQALLGRHCPEAGQRLLKDLGALAEREPHLGPAGLRIVIEHGTRNGDHPSPAGQAPAERHAVGLAKPSYVGCDEVGARGPVHLKSRLSKDGAEQVALADQAGTDPGEVGVRHSQRVGDGVLERAAADVGEELLDAPDRRDKLGSRGHPADLPAGERERLAGRADRYGAFAHAGQRADREVLAFVDYVLVHLVGDDQQVVLARQ